MEDLIPEIDGNKNSVEQPISTKETQEKPVFINVILKGCEIETKIPYVSNLCIHGVNMHVTIEISGFTIKTKTIVNGEEKILSFFWNGFKLLQQNGIICYMSPYTGMRFIIV